MQAKSYGDNLVTIVALDETAQRIKWERPDHTQDERKKALELVGISKHTVQLWHPNNVYTCLDEHVPDVIYLGYDQQSFDSGIVSYYTWQSKEIPHIIRWVAYHPDKYKSSLLKKL
jgi:glycerol-3-phosphate cytidylyltransferase-like family protein